MQDAANDHREKLRNLSQLLLEIDSKPTVIDDDDFEHKLKSVQEQIDILADDAKSGAGGGDRTLVERLKDLNDRLTSVNDLLIKSDDLEKKTGEDISMASNNFHEAENTVLEAQNELTVNN